MFRLFQVKQQEVSIHRTACITWVNPDLEKHQQGERRETDLDVFLTSLIADWLCVFNVSGFTLTF
ncbi:MAG: hypothetical protein MH137_05270 [Flavobacteriales bacterium]|nr:hypothetical protein [Flavobacteriales bacterium]